MSDETRDPELAALEAALSALRPAPDQIGRDQFLFRAGQASVRRRWLWPAATAALALVVAVESGLLLKRPPRAAPQTPPQTTHPEPDYVPDVPSAEDGYLHLRRVALRDGVEALPRVPSKPAAQAPEKPIRSLPWSGDSL